MIIIMVAGDIDRGLAGEKGCENEGFMRIVNRGVCREGLIDRRGVPTVTSVLCGARYWLYNINIQPL